MAKVLRGKRAVKNFLVALLVLTALLLMCAPAFADTPNNSGLSGIIVDGKVMQFTSGDTIEVNNRVLVPVRTIAESLGAYVNWDDTTQAVTLRKFGREVKLTVGKQDVVINGSTYYSDIPSRIQNGSVYAPMQFVCEALGAAVDENNGVVTVNSTPSNNVVPTSAPKPVEPFVIPSGMPDVMVEIANEASTNIGAYVVLTNVINHPLISIYINGPPSSAHMRNTPDVSLCYISSDSSKYVLQVRSYKDEKALKIAEFILNRFCQNAEAFDYLLKVIKEVPAFDFEANKAFEDQTLYFNDKTMKAYRQANFIRVDIGEK